MLKGFIGFLIIVGVILFVVSSQNTEIVVVPSQNTNIKGDLNIDGNIILKSQDGNTWVCDVNNSGVFDCVLS